MDGELADLIAAEAASMTDKELLDHYDDTDAMADPRHHEILADEVAQRFRNEVLGA